ncbi:ATP synthase F0 subunit B [uncultured Desulfuromonas sp.]|uniref:ATP synthase F0 subunit B n=1 Tax=uncultured Desulfuromonas sp. TaxID=181013 RepID=UPI002AAB8174|nr:ATP synthase F0 subunit B [uncultured Desulfuromonas sp.]
MGFVLAGAGIALASGDAHHVDSGALLKDFLWRVLDFCVMAAILVYFVAKPLKNALAARREGIEQALKASQEAAESAESKYAEYDSKLTQAESEIAGIQVAIREEAESEKQRIISEAKEMAEKIKAEAQKSADNEVAKARLTLQQEAVTMAVGIAEDILKKAVNKEDQARLVEEYKTKVGELH